MTNSGYGCLACLSSFICPISTSVSTQNDPGENNQTGHSGKTTLVDRNVEEQQQISLEISQHAQSVRDLKSELHWLVKGCNALPNDSRCALVCSEIKAYECKIRVSNERYMEVKLLVDHQRYKQTMDRRKRISTVMKRDKPLYALIQKEHDIFIDNVNEMEELNTQMMDESKELHPNSESGNIDFTQMVESCVEEIESCSTKAHTREDNRSNLPLTHTSPVPISTKDTFCISDIQPRYSQEKGGGEGGIEADVFDLSEMEARLVQ
jgi:hypothetical protein